MFVPGEIKQQLLRKFSTVYFVSPFIRFFERISYPEPITHTQRERMPQSKEIAMFGHLW